MQRRELVRSGLIGAAAAAAASAAGTVQAAHGAQEKKRITEDWDVVVVGAGFAGMCAALEAAEQGAKTILLEKMNRPDGATVYSSGWIAAVGSRFQKGHPEDSPKAFFDDMMRLSHQRSDPELIKVYAEESGAGIDWLADHGTPFYLWENLPSPELSRCLISPGEGITGGSKLIRCLMDALAKKGVEIRYNTKAVELVKDDCFNVEGVSCITPEGRRDFLARGGVILTTGGYGANEAMVCKYIGPWASRLIVRGSPWITGENILMAEEVQALLVNMDQFYAGPITPTGHCNPSPLMHAGYGIQVNTKGKRFVPETWLQVPKAKAIAERTEDNRSFMLIGADADKNAQILTNTIKRFARLGFEVIKADTIEEAAKKAGVPEKALVETVREFNAAVKAGKAKELDPPYEYDEPHALETGPYYMIPAAGGMASTFGGPKINKDAQVVNFERRPIPGLYAAGAAAGGVWVYDDIGGNQLGGGMVFGRVPPERLIPLEEEYAMQFNRFAAAVLTAGALALLSITPAGAADGKFLADRHVEHGVACSSCHGTDAPKPGAQVASTQCNTCHGSLDAVAKHTAKLDPNPHYNHLVGLECAECHRAHAKSVNMCAQCHNIKYNVP